VPLLSRLLKVGSVTDSLGAYVPAKILQKGLGLARLLLFIYMLPKAQFALWGLGMMIFTIVGPLLSLGTQHGLVRYAAHYEVQGQLNRFYRRVRWPILALAAGMTVLALTGSEWITWLFISGKSSTAELSHQQQLRLCWAAVGNALALVLYHNALSVLIGMRAYRLVSVVEIFFTMVFTAAGALLLVFWPTGLAALVGHLIGVLASLALALAGLHLLLGRAGKAPGPSVGPEASLAAEADAVESISYPDDVAALTDLSAGGRTRAGEKLGREAFLRVLKFGLAALPGYILWRWASYTSFWLTSKIRGMSEGGEFLAFLSLGQPIVFLADAVWAVVFTHVVNHWESGRRRMGMSILQTAYKAVGLAMLGLTLLVLAGAPVWIRILPPRYHQGLSLLAGLLMFFQVMIHLGLLTILAKLHERPWVIAVAALIGIAANVILALRWMPQFAYPPRAAALAAGVGIYFGSTVVSIFYVLITRTRLHAATFVMVFFPAVLLLWLPIAGAVWAVAALVAVCTPWIFSAQEKRTLLGAAGQIVRLLRRALP